MPLIRCPHCSTSVDIHPDDAGYKVLCPGCRSAFQAGDAERPAPAPLSKPSPVVPEKASTVVCRCTACQGEVTIAVEDVGFLMLCPICGAHFQAEKLVSPLPMTIATVQRDEIDEEGEESEDRGSRLRPEDREYILESAKGAITGPANGLLWTGILSAILSIFGGLLIAAQVDLFTPQFTAVLYYFAAAYYGVFGSIYHGFLALAGYQMKKLRGTAWGYTGASFAIASLLVIGFFIPTTWLCLAFGIWTLIAYSKREVKDAIRINQGRELS